MKPDQATIDALKSKHGELEMMSFDEACFVYRTPSMKEYERFVDGIASDKGSAAIKSREIAHSCIVFPSQDEVAALFAKKPGAILPVAAAIIKLAGFESEAEVKKL